MLALTVARLKWNWAGHICRMRVKEAVSLSSSTWSLFPTIIFTLTSWSDCVLAILDLSRQLDLTSCQTFKFYDYDWQILLVYSWQAFTYTHFNLCFLPMGRFILPLGLWGTGIKFLNPIEKRMYLLPDGSCVWRAFCPSNVVGFFYPF